MDYSTFGETIEAPATLIRWLEGRGLGGGQLCNSPELSAVTIDI